MDYLESIMARRNEYEKETSEFKQDLESERKELARLERVAQNTPLILDQLDREFSERTSLNWKDIGFLFAATALQCIRIYVINELTKVEKAGAGNAKENGLHKLQDRIFKNFNADGDQISFSYHASMEHIITARGVPYDATAFAGEKYDFFKGANHRFATFGHDPILGLVIGTTNILTNTITCRTHEALPIPVTCHVIYDTYGQNPQIGPLGSTIAALNAAGERVGNDTSAVAAALIKQIIHIGTDLYTPCGIQIPGANLVLNNTYAEQLTKYISMGDIIKFGASYKIFLLINTLIGTLHMLTCPSQNSRDRELYHVKTMKILEYSNLIATGSNVIFNAVRMYLGEANAVKNIDFAGLVGTIMMLINDLEFKRKVKEEFIFGSYNELITERKYKLIGDYGGLL